MQPVIPIEISWNVEIRAITVQLGKARFKTGRDEGLKHSDSKGAPQRSGQKPSGRRRRHFFQGHRLHVRLTLANHLLSRAVTLTYGLNTEQRDCKRKAYSKSRDDQDNDLPCYTTLINEVLDA